MKKPNFFILGAPKCGTTSLAAWLRDHPQIYLPPVKEPNRFSADIPREVSYSEAEYRELYKDLPADVIWACDASTTYLRSRVAVKEIINYSDNPADIRYLVAVRNPIEMVLSVHAHRVRGGREKNKDFEAAWKEEMIHGRSSIKNPLSTYGALCKIGGQLQRLYETVCREQIHVVLLEDVMVDPRREYLKILNFLGLQDDRKQNFPVYNPASSVPSWLAKSGNFLQGLKNLFAVRRSFGLFRRMTIFLGRSGGKSILSTEMRLELGEYFSEDLELLGKLLGRDLRNEFNI